jgi:hypothetical protein
MGARVVPTELAVAHAHERLGDDQVREGLRDALDALVAEASPLPVAA